MWVADATLLYSKILKLFRIQTGKYLSVTKLVSDAQLEIGM